MGFLDLPDQPDEPGRPERASAGGEDRPTPKRRELPDPDERGWVYEVMRAHASAETAGEPSDATGESPRDQQPDGTAAARAEQIPNPEQRGDEAHKQKYRDEVPRFMDTWADHQRRWPERQRPAEPDRAADPSESYRSEGGFEMNPQRHAEAIEAISRIRYVTHEAYEWLRNPHVADEERRELEDFQREVSSHIQVPDGAADIPDFKKEGF